MRSKVYFSDFKIRNQERDAKIYKIDRLCQAAGIGEVISKGDLTAVKLHFGEKGNEGYINPVFVRRVVDQIRALSAEPFLTDTNTLYVGERQDAVHHLKLAVEHGFDYAVVNAPLVIADGLKGDNYREISLKSKHYSSVRIANDILAADSMVVLCPAVYPGQAYRTAVWRSCFGRAGTRTEKYHPGYLDGTGISEPSFLHRPCFVCAVAKYY